MKSFQFHIKFFKHILFIYLLKVFYVFINLYLLIHMQIEDHQCLDLSKFVKFETLELSFQNDPNENNKLYPTGLFNPENDCYFNSALQILSHIQQFKQYLEENTHKHQESLKAKFFDQLVQFFKNMQLLNKKALSSKDLLETFRKCHPNDFFPDKPNDFRKLYKFIFQDLRQVCKQCPNIHKIQTLMIGIKKIKKGAKQQKNLSPFIEIQPQSEELQIAMKNSIGSISKQVGFKQRLDRLYMEDFPQILAFSINYSPKQLVNSLKVNILQSLFFLKNQLKPGQKGQIMEFINFNQLKQRIAIIQRCQQELSGFKNSQDLQLIKDTKEHKQKLMKIAYDLQLNFNEYQVWGIAIYMFDQIRGTAHYKAFIRNQYDNLWYEYNDDVVTKIEKQRIHDLQQNQLPYCVFYKRINKGESVKITFIRKYNQKIRLNHLGNKIINNKFHEKWAVAEKYITNISKKIDEIVEETGSSRKKIDNHPELKNITPLFFFYAWVPLLFKLSQFKIQFNNNLSISSISNDSVTTKNSQKQSPKKNKILKMGKVSTKQALQILSKKQILSTPHRYDKIVEKVLKIAICIYCYQYFYFRHQILMKQVKHLMNVKDTTMLQVKQVKQLEQLKNIIDFNLSNIIKKFIQKQLKRTNGQLVSAYQNLFEDYKNYKIRIRIQNNIKLVSNNSMFFKMCDLIFLKGIGYYFYLTHPQYKRIQYEYPAQQLKQIIDQYFKCKSQGKLLSFKNWHKLKDKINLGLVDTQEHNFEKMNQTLMVQDFFLKQYTYEIQLYYGENFTQNQIIPIFAKRIYELDKAWKSSDNPFSTRLLKHDHN